MPFKMTESAVSICTGTTVFVPRNRDTVSVPYRETSEGKHKVFCQETLKCIITFYFYRQNMAYKWMVSQITLWLWLHFYHNGRTTGVISVCSNLVQLHSATLIYSCYILLYIACYTYIVHHEQLVHYQTDIVVGYNIIRCLLKLLNKITF